MAWVTEEFILVFIRDSSENYKLPEDEEKILNYFLIKPGVCVSDLFIYNSKPN